MPLFSVRVAEQWTPASVAAGLLLLAGVVALVVWLTRR
jgi:MYXO-CTERM domain-containing protein